MILWFLVACRPGEAVRYDGHVLARVQVTSPEEIDEIVRVGGDLWSEHASDHVDVRLSPVARAALRLPYEILLPDVQAAIDASRVPAAAVPGYHDDWHTVDEIDVHLDELADRASFAEVLTLGTSIEGHEIHALRLLVGAAADDRPGLLVTATQHAREWVAASSAVFLAETLVDGYGVDPRVTDLLDAYRVTIVPVVNPDGYEFTWNTDRLWRKNRRDNLDGSYGVDLNRNWEQAFGGIGSSGLTTSDNYRGTGPFSEPETDAVRAFVEDHRAYSVHVDLHSFGQVALHPWGSSGAAASDAASLSTSSTDVAAAMTALYGTNFDSGQIYTRLYPASGVAVDWTYGVHGMSSVLIELRDRGAYGFLLPADQIVPSGEEVVEGLLALTVLPAPLRLALWTDDAWTASARAVVRAHRAQAGDIVTFGWSTTGPGTTVLPDGTVLELDLASRLGARTADASGSAGLAFQVPPGASGTTVWFQAASQGVRSTVLEVTVD